MKALLSGIVQCSECKAALHAVEQPPFSGAAWLE